MDLTSEASPHTWSSTFSLITKRVGLGAAVVGEVLYVLGGSTNYDNSGALNTMEAHSLQNGSKVAKASMTTPRWLFGVGVVQGLVCAGRNLANEPFLLLYVRLVPI